MGNANGLSDGSTLPEVKQPIGAQVTTEIDAVQPAEKESVNGVVKVSPLASNDGAPVLQLDNGDAKGAE